MNRNELQKISRVRLKEARALLQAGHHPGAYYLAGYSVECALKACIAKQTGRHDFPDKDLASKAWTHDLDTLIKLAGLQRELAKDTKVNRTLDINWATVKDWSVSTRYVVDISRAVARDFYLACTARKYGILSWIKKRW